MIVSIVAFQLGGGLVIAVAPVATNNSLNALLNTLSYTVKYYSELFYVY
jgi:hypothetical protein